MESQMERIGRMGGKIFILSLSLIILGGHPAFSKKESEEDVPISDIEGDNQSNNQVLMYRMLNSQTKDPSDILYYRRWKKERKLQWLANHRNLLIPGMIDDAEETY